MAIVLLAVAAIAGFWVGWWLSLYIVAGIWVL